jgi:hypothetical protein
MDGRGVDQLLARVARVAAGQRADEDDRGDRPLRGDQLSE